jgi:glycosyltransferase involved in cell wall biosynthesis
MILSDIPVFREITEGQGVYFPHSDPDAISVAIEDVLSSSSESDRLIKYGCKRVEDFSFKNISLDLARLHQSLA